MEKKTKKEEMILHESMSALYKKAAKGKMPLKDIIAQAVQLGINYEEKLIKEGINIVFESTHAK